VLTSSDVSETSGFCTEYCGWHNKMTPTVGKVRFSFVGNPAKCINSCAAQSTGPNGNAGADAMASVIVHELEETVTDPDLNAWFDSSGSENADKCAWTFGTTYTASNGSSYNVTLGGVNYLLQRNWDARIGACAMDSSITEILVSAPTSLTFNARFGGANPTSQILNITDSKNNIVNWSANENTGWLKVSSATGSTPGSTTVSVDISGLAAGTYNSTINLSAAGVTQIAVPVKLKISSETITASPSSLSFVAKVGGANPSNQTLSITGSSTLAWVASENNSWLSLNSTSGNTPGSTSVSVNISGMAVGTYNATITVTSDAASSPLNVPVTLRIYNDSLSSGQNLLPDQFLTSQNGQYRLIMQADGNLVVYNSSSQPLWSSNTGGQAVRECLMQADGNLVIYKTNGQALWSSNTGGNTRSSLQLQDDGYVAIKNSASTLIWGTWDTLFHDQQLIPGQILYSQNRQYRLVMQGDGNLVMYNSSNQPLWASNTGGQSIKNCLMNADGNLIIYKTTGQVSWASNTGDKGKSRLVIQNDGNLVIYTLNPQYPTWDRFHGRL
jgi:hypothetical protein